VRFVHTSDWHLGRLFHGVHLTDDQAHVLAQLVDLLADERPDALIVAGDVYDRAVPPVEAVQLLDEVLAKIVLDLKIPTVVIAGNHDSAERLGFGSRLLRDRGLYVTGALSGAAATVSFEDEHGPVDLVPIPYASPEATRAFLDDEEVRGHDAALRALTARARDGVRDGARSVAVAHAFVTGASTSESERPLTVGGTGEVGADVFDGFSYTALGHLHRPQNVGSERVRYSGSLLKYSFSEADHGKSVSIVELDATGAVTVDERALAPRRDVRVLEGRFDDLLKAPAASDDEDYLLVRLQDEQMILDVMARLRDRYPNVLHVERPEASFASTSGAAGLDHNRMTPLQLFDAFWKDLRPDDELDDEARATLKAAIARAEGVSAEET
jgi:exonuclease SbcD